MFAGNQSWEIGANTAQGALARFGNYEVGQDAKTGVIGKEMAAAGQLLL
jgi:hypothetical protein